MTRTRIAAPTLRRTMISAALALSAGITTFGTASAAPVTVPGIGPMPQTVEQKAVSNAESKLGAPYVWGATGPDAFDCSGLMQWAYKQAGISIPRTSQAQETAGTPVTLNALQPGDLVFFYGGEHVGMYLGDGKVIHSPDTGDHVKITRITAMPANTARHY